MRRPDNMSASEWLSAQNEGRKPARSVGLGDAVHAAAVVTGAARLSKYVNRLRGKRCKCNARRRRWNRRRIKIPSVLTKLVLWSVR